MVPLRVHLGPERKMAPSKEQHSPLPGNSKRRSTNRKNSTFTSLKDSRSMDINRWILSRANNTPPPNNHNMGQSCQIRAHKENRHVVLLSDYCKEINWIPPRRHINGINPMPVYQIYRSMYRPTRRRSPIKHSNKHSFRTFIYSWTEKWITLWHTRVQTHTGPNEYREY